MASTFPIAVVSLLLLSVCFASESSRARANSARLQEPDHSEEGDECYDAVQLGRMETNQLCHKRLASQMEMWIITVAFGGFIVFLIGMWAGSSCSGVEKEKAVPSTPKAEAYSSFSNIPPSPFMAALRAECCSTSPDIPLSPLGVALMAECRSARPVRNERARRVYHDY
jgi:hypothetical protein